MKLDVAIDDVQDAEMDLAKRLVALAERHHVESDVYHQGLARAHKCAEHVWAMRPFVEQYDAHAVDVEDATAPGFIDVLRRSAATVVARQPMSGMLLVTDLRDTYVAAHRADIGWITLQQGAKAVRDAGLVAVVAVALDETEQTWKWLKTRIKTSAAQVLATG